MIDWTRIKQLRDEIGEEDFPEVVEIFIEEVSGMIDSLRTAPSVEIDGLTASSLFNWFPIRYSRRKGLRY